MNPQETNNKLTKIYENINVLHERCMIQASYTDKDYNRDLKFVRAISGNANSIRNLVKDLKI